MIPLQHPDKVTVTDGPLAKTKKCLPGFHIIEARDLNECLQIPSRNAPAAAGSMEVRSVRPIGEVPNSHRKK